MQLARLLHISNSRVCDLVDQMVAEGLILEEESAGDRRGRRGVKIRLNPDVGVLVGFDMEAKRLRMVATDFQGTVIWQSRRALDKPASRKAAIDEILGFIDAGFREVRVQFGQPLAMGIAASGVIDTKRGTILHYDIRPEFVDLPVRELICREVNVPCVMENNIRAMALAEWVAGAARGLHTFACVAVRSGVGAGMIINGRLRGGDHGFCGEIGYSPIANGGSVWKNLQQMVSESALGVDAEAEGFEIPDAVAKRCGEVLGTHLVSMAAFVDPEAFVLAGSVLNPMGKVWPHVVSTFRRQAFPELVERVQLLPARLGAFAAAQGAAHRAMYELFPVATAVTA
jgi:predicted NBD/HSP70 family sugar kinase